jgi:hypothetical protein
MSAWANIVVSPDDPEIVKIDKLEQSLGVLPANIQRIRTLITRFEVCHFKYQQHISHIKEAIKNLKTDIDPEKIGASHFRNGPGACKNDRSGRSLLGQKYVQGLKSWLGEEPEVKDEKLRKKVFELLGKKDPAKEKLVRLLIARLLNDWKDYEKWSQAEGNEALKLQASGIDVCHYDFPRNMDLQIQGIGQMKPVEDFLSCGSYNPEIKSILEKEFLALNQDLKSLGHDSESRIRAWLTACLAKTIKADVGLKDPIAIT